MTGCVGAVAEWPWPKQWPPCAGGWGASTAVAALSARWQPLRQRSTSVASTPHTHTHTHNKHRHISAQDCRNVAQAQQAAQNTQHTRNVHHQGDVGGAARRGRHAETRRLGHQACRRCFVSRHGGWVHWYQNIGETTARTRRGGCSSAWCQRRGWRPACRLYDGVTNHATTQAGSRDNAMERGQIFAAGA